jgi:hypothetical protein
MAEAPAVIVNIKTDFGATGNGIDSDYAAFQAFNAWALQWQQSHSGLIELDIPPGVYMFSQSGQGSSFAKGIKQLLVKGYGATLSDNNGAGGGFFLGGGGIESGNGGFGYTDSWTARAATVSAGSDSITLLDPARTSIFSVGSWALMTGLDLMGYGFPPDPQFFEYVQITAINPTTGQVTFAAPLKNSYESTWPNYSSGAPGLQADQGGPATLYALDPSWDTEVEYDGLTIDQAGPIYANGRSVTFKDTNFNDGAEIPSENMTWTLLNVNMPNSVIEVDKLVTTMNVTGGTLGGLAFQSASVDTLNMNGTTVSGFMNGTPKTADLSNDNIANLGVGAYAYGASSEITVANSVLGSIAGYGVYENGEGSGLESVYSMSNGVITSPNSNGSLRWAVPGATLIWRGQYGWEGEFKVLDVTQDANNTYVTTTMSDGFPSLGAVNLALNVDPAVNSTFINDTGSPEALSLSQAPAGSPLYSYSNHTYTGNFGNTPSFEQWGKLVSIKIDVTKPYTGSKPSLDVEALGQFGSFVLNPNGSISEIDPTINLKVAGERDITPTSVTGLQSGDNISAPGPITFTGSLNAFMGLNGTLADISSDDPSTWPSVSIEIVTDQGFSDSTPPPLAVTIGLENDTGSLATDEITSDPTLTGSGDPNDTTAPVLTPVAPTLSVSNNPNAMPGQQVSLSTLVAISDPDTVGYQKLELWDDNGTVTGGEFVVNGTPQTGGHEIDVAPANVASTVFDVGTLGGTDTLWARLLENDGTLTAWQQFSVTAPADTGPAVISVANSIMAGQTFAVASLFAASDPFNDPIIQYDFWDTGGGDGYLALNNQPLGANQDNYVTSGQLGQTTFVAGTGTDTLLVRVSDGPQWSPFSIIFTSVGAGATSELLSAYSGTIAFAGSTGTLKLDTSASFTGTVAGLTGQDTIDFADINFANAQQPSFSGNASGGMLSVTDGTHTANIALLGNYIASIFVASSDGHGGTAVVDPPASQPPPLAQSNPTMF